MPEEEQEITAPFETDALQAGWAAKASAAPPRCHAVLTFGAKTDLGRVRENNEDKFDFLETDDPALLAAKGRVYAVADGMGGHSAGQVAAELALNIFIRSYYADGSAELESSLQRAVREANRHVVEVASTVAGRKGMGATLTAVVIREDHLFVAQVGDSRCYLLRDGRLEQITEDHSWVAEQVRAGTMTLAQAEQSPFRNVITRSMGGAAEVEPDLTAVQIMPGDRYLLCSDGLSGMVSDDELAEMLRQGAPSMVVWNLIDRANQRGGKDNITAVVIEIQRIEDWAGASTAQAAEAASNGRTAAAPPAGYSAATAAASAPVPPNAVSQAPAVEAPQRPAPPVPGRNPGLLGRLFGRA